MIRFNGLNFCFSFDGIAKAASSHKACNGIKHKFRHMETEKLLCNPACHKNHYEDGNGQLPQAEVSLLIFKKLADKKFHRVGLNSNEREFQ